VPRDFCEPTENFNSSNLLALSAGVFHIVSSVLNLLLNAIKASRNGAIDPSTTADRHHLHILFIFCR